MASCGKGTPEYEIVKSNLGNITRALQLNAAASQSLRQKFIEKEWLDSTARPTEEQLVTLALGRIEQDVSQYGEFIAMLRDIEGMDLIVKKLKVKPQESKPRSGFESAAASSPPPLSIDDLQEVREALEDVGKKWFDLGLALGLRQPTLQRIKDDNADDINDCKREMLTQWLYQIDKSKPSWRSLVDALRNKTVKCEPIASSIEGEYLM